MSSAWPASFRLRDNLKVSIRVGCSSCSAFASFFRYKTKVPLLMRLAFFKLYQLTISL